MRPVPESPHHATPVRRAPWPLRYIDRRRPAAGLVLALAAIVVACSGEPASPHDHPTELTPAQAAGIEQVRASLGRLGALAAATGSGYTEQFPAGCAASAEGAQGFHYLNPAFVDTRIELLNPELVMYEPQADGSMRLVGVDYVVPIEAWTGSAPPTLLGVPFMRNEPLGVWALHIWAWRENPSGAFAAWNPKVTCAHAR